MADGRRIEIDANGMRDFSAKLQTYVDKDIAPTTEFVRQQLQTFGAFGIHSASPVVQDAAKRYWLVMDQAITFLRALSHNTDTLAKTAKDIVTTYHDADVSSVDFLHAVEGGVSTQLTKSEQAAAAADQRAETQDRLDLLHERGGLRGGAA
ncbi:hypothetical protein [Dactylosporangium sp. CA-233914]|uniref:hypothetical protein n=1 Tax=Dactylosporangium sp. CA-233914 TaxID=3239934 RepID=UPI003D8F5676